ncbi:MAG TPA: dephospho-CoA kinase, partial [Rhodospirillales bacterium]|nr:dephospho-CoA kinase [Rhodospirillales bacterium]
MRILGLTGSIAMGKSFAASVFDAFGVPVFDADAAVHRLLGPGGAAVAPVGDLFPEAIDRQGGVDRAVLGRRVFADRAALRRLEAILHPLVRDCERRFLERCARAGARLAVLDIPLLLETGGDRRTDRVAVVTCHPMLQAQRALRRPGMTAERLAAIRAAQMSEAEKRRRADYVIPTGQGKGTTLAIIRRILLDMRRIPAG